MIDECENKCGLFDFMVNEIGIKVLHPGGYKSTKELCSKCDINQNSHVLDLACGVGTTSFYIHEKYSCKVTGIDINESLISIAKQTLLGKQYKEGLSFKVANALKLPFPDNTFDTVIAQAVLILIDDNEKVLEEIYRVLKPGGCFGSLELSWFTAPSEEAYTELKNKTCEDFIPRVRTFDEWENLATSKNLTHLSTLKKPMDSGMLKMLESEGLTNFFKIMYKMISKKNVRKRMMTVQEAFAEYKNYLGYGIYHNKKT